LTGLTNDVVCVHGLWMPGAIMIVLRRRLEKQYGFRGREYSYHSVVGSLDQSIARLRRQVELLAPARTHVVAHSLGGVVALQTLRRHPDLPVGRVVCLGSPLVDSEPARFLQRFDWGRPIVGRTLLEGVLENPLGEWTGAQQVGVIAGTTPFGTARFFLPLSDPNDGVVASAETRLPGITDHIEMPVSHSGLVFADIVVRQVAAFLRDGCFTTA
jgi:pimeloyl-ACP methyl ester carboxylesterase